MRFVASLIVLFGMVGLPVYYWTRLFGKDETVYSKRWVIRWTVRGLVVPLLIWFLLNAGSTPTMPALVNVSPFAGTSWWHKLLYAIAYITAQMSPAMIAVGSFWAALTMGWFVVAKLRRTEDGKLLRTEVLIVCLLAMPVSALILLGWGLAGAGFALLLCAWPSAHYAQIARPEKPAPHYSKAVAKMKFGKYRDAEIAILEELEKSESDFDGWMMLAELYAKRFNDLGEASRTIHELCGEPATTLPQVSVALHQLADWQLELWHDPVSARRTLDEICARMPGTHLAHMAELRANRLPRTADELEKQQRPKTVAMPVFSEALDDIATARASKAGSDEALEAVKQLVEKLKLDPDDVVLREKLAAVLAEQMNEPGLAIEQLELLIEMPEQPERKRAAWLGTIAHWHATYRKDARAARGALERLVREHPRSPEAFAAQQRLCLMETESRGRKAGFTAGSASLSAKEVS